MTPASPIRLPSSLVQMWPMPETPMMAPSATTRRLRRVRGSVRWVHEAISFVIAGRVPRPAVEGSCCTF